jgi:putative CRISPR-associated protein (TIGR02620 family)
MKNTIIVTKHKALQQYIVEIGLADDSTPIYNTITPELIQGKHVVGLLPIRFAQFADTYTEILITLPKSFHGKELTIEQVRDYADTPTTYRVNCLGNPAIGGL